MLWIEVIGFCGSALAILTYWMREMIPLRIVAVTGYGQEEDRGRSRESGFDQHLTKPVDPDALQAFVSGASTG